MDAVAGYDASKLHALRRELDRLNAAAARSGLIASGLNLQGDAPGALIERSATGSADKGKAGAKRLLTILGRIDADVSPSIPGTSFTEDGVVRLLAHLRKRRSRERRGNLFFRRMLTFVTRPVSMGVRTSAGISVERLRVISRQLRDIEANGWNHFQTTSAAQRRKRQVIS